MEKATGRILKGDDVQLQGQLQLEVTQVAPGPSKGKNVALAAPQASILENHPEFAVIEIICSCGAKTHLRCEYADVQSSAGQETDQAE